MAVIVRSGTYGTYYGNNMNSSNALNNSQMAVNAVYIASYLRAAGWSDNAIAGMLGNMQSESAINPGRWQSDDVGNYGLGYGLVQWTPVTKYTNWCTASGISDPSEMDSNLQRIIYEVENNVQYFSTANYPEDFGEFTKSGQTPYYLACAFAWNYERSHVVLYGSEEEREALRQARGGQANYWYEVISGVAPPQPPPEPGRERKKKYKFFLFKKRRSSQKWKSRIF